MMTAIPENKVTSQDLIAWKEMQEQLGKLKAAEMLLRQKIYAGLFVEPHEGTNTVPLNEGWVLKANRVINRKVDLPVLQAYSAPGGPLEKMGVNPNNLIEWEPKLKVKEYRTLTEEQRLVFDTCLTISDGSPSMQIMLPAKAKK
jgi:hypothetical protein